MNKQQHPRHIQELEHAFRYFDANGDGKISVAELGGVLKSLGENPSEEDLRTMVREVDADGDGFVDFDEFVHLNTEILGDALAASVEELKAAFYVFDTDKNGYISAEELYKVMFNLGEKGVTMEDCNRMIGGVDSDGDGFVNFEEFQRMMLSSSNASPSTA
ncbi:hypothetical protein SELMODRAFT_94292 [Selaginella moellendorffii]|uniref:EF-hand domain-containing protein n=1 Tax=Selaginella moellendorffii TaxID=88036 RepID=D8RI97_SELML|nr:hypothetical protein SELMODRAFT_94292 [Selaginella moellendorffii]